MDDEGARFRTGLALGLGAYGLWGVLPVYFLLMRAASPFEIVGWRITLSLVFCGLLIAVTRSWRTFTGVLRDRRAVGLLGLAGALIWVNWTVYVAASTSGHVVDAALGYFINPIVTVLLGVLVLHERLRPLQWAAIGIATVAVVALVVETGSVPLIALALAGSFGCYGLIKKQVGSRVDVVSGLTLESAWLTPVAVIQLVVVGLAGPGLTFGRGPGVTLLLSSLGVVTAVPLLLFAASTRRLPLSVAGFLQFLAPILQFVFGVTVLHESMPPGRWIGFALVWVALVVLVGESTLRLRRRPIRATEAVPLQR